MNSDFAIVTLTDPDLARLCGTDRVLIEAVEMHDRAILVGMAREWEVLGANFNVPPSAWLNVPAEYRSTFERLFISARKQTQGPDYHDARHQPRPASEPLRQYAPVRYTPGKRTR